MAKTNRIAFTMKRVESLSIPSNKRVYWYDTDCRGLAVCVNPTGAKVFYLYKWHNGRPTRTPLGNFPEISVETARKQAKALLGDMARGLDPHAARQAARHEQTVGGLWEFWLETHAKQHKRSWKEDERQFNVFLKSWSHRRLSAIKKADVQTLHAKVGTKNGHYAANRLLALVRAMFNKAADMGFTGPNPTAGINKFKEVKRDRFLEGDELPAFFRSLVEEPNETLRDFFLLALLTGARRANIQAMAWVDLDLTARYWRIPETKSGVPVVVPLVPAAVALLTTRKQTTNGSPWVFPSRSKCGHLTEPKAAWKRIIERAGLKNLRPHDLRRSLGSWQAMGGASLPIIGKSLGHTQQSTTQIYARLQMDPVRDSVGSATDAILEAAHVAVDSDGVKLLLTSDKGGDHGQDQE